MGDSEIEEHPITLIRRAAKGDADAQSTMLQMSYDEGLDLTRLGGDLNARYLAMYEAAIYGRMAAENGGTAQRATLISLLAIVANLAEELGDVERSTEFMAEALALSEMIAEEGLTDAGETAANLIAGNADSIPPAVIQKAKHYKAIWSANLQNIEGGN